MKTSFVKNLLFWALLSDSPPVSKHMPKVDNEKPNIKVENKNTRTTSVGIVIGFLLFTSNTCFCF